MSGSFAHHDPTTNPPTFYRDVLPILEQHCQSCHRAGGIAPVPFETYRETRPFADAIRRATKGKSMPPWFADPKVGQFSNDPSLRPAEIGALAAWAEAKSPAGETKEAPLASRSMKSSRGGASTITSTGK
jgi:mono/diheme cytochrome c family protein